MQNDQVLSNLYTFFHEKGWKLLRCLTCNNQIFSKSENTVCGRKECKQEKSFLSLSKQNKIIKPQHIKNVVGKQAVKAGYRYTESIPLTAKHGETDLIIAGVQLYNGVIHGERKPCYISERCVVSQPCVRMQFVDKVGEMDGISTAFVNACTEHVGASIEDHVIAIDFWLDVLSSLGLHAYDMSLVYRTKIQNWGTGDFVSHDLFFMYGDLEIGDASYVAIPAKHEDGLNPLLISDIGFGVERIAWAINKTDTYYDALLPWGTRFSVQVNDLYRTLTLLAMTGIKPGPKGAGLQFRRLVKRLNKLSPNVLLSSLVNHYFLYWSAFTKHFCDSEICFHLISYEYDRLRNNEIASNNHWPTPKENESTEEYLERMVYSKIVTPSELRKMYTL